VVSYASEKEIARVPVGDHPQRMRMGTMRCDYLGPAVDCDAPRLAVKVNRRRRGGRRLRARLSEPARLRIVVSRARRGRLVRGRCRAARREATVARRCNRWAQLRVLRPRARKGMNRLSLGRLRVAAGHRVLVRATDAAGNSSPRKRVRFRIRRR